MSKLYRFCYPIMKAEPAGILSGYERLDSRIRTQNIVPGGAIGHIHSRLSDRFLCDDDLTKAMIATKYDCKKTTMRESPFPGRLLCPTCLEKYLESNDRDATRYRAWNESRALDVSAKSHHFS